MSARMRLAGLAGAALLMASGAAPADELQGEAALEQGGAALFQEKCAMCHREPNMVTGMGSFLIAARDPNGDPMLEHRDFLIPEYIAVAIRTGIGNMPRISRAEVSDAQLAEIAAYVVETAASHEEGAE